MRDFDDTLGQDAALRAQFDDYLDANEVVVGVFKPNKKRFYRGFLFLAIPLFWPHFILLTVLTLGIFPFVYAKKGYDNLCYAYTNKRVIERGGSFGLTFRGIDYADIISTEVTTSLLDRSTHTGSIDFRTQHRGVSFRYIVNPYDVLREIREYIEQHT